MQRQIIPARGHWSGVIARGGFLRIIDLEGRQAVDFLFYNAHDPAERYYAPNTIKKAASIELGAGQVLYSDRARPLLTIVEDTFGGHDTIGGCCSLPSNEMLYGIANPGCRENFLAELEPRGLGWKDIVPNVNWFMKVPVTIDGAATIATGTSVPGDQVLLRAEMDVLAIISNCPQVLNPCNDFNPTPVAIEFASHEDD